jgi:hypothetical protein
MVSMVATAPTAADMKLTWKFCSRASLSIPAAEPPVPAATAAKVGPEGKAEREASGTIASPAAMAVQAVTAGLAATALPAVSVEMRETYLFTTFPTRAPASHQL